MIPYQWPVGESNLLLKIRKLPAEAQNLLLVCHIVFKYLKASRQGPPGGCIPFLIYHILNIDIFPKTINIR